MILIQYYQYHGCVKGTAKRKQMYLPFQSYLRFLATVRYHERKIAEAKNECSRAPWYKKYICIGTAAKVTYHGLAVGGLYVAYGTAKAVLKAANFFLKGVQAVIKVSSPNDLTTILILLCSMNLSICPFS